MNEIKTGVYNCKTQADWIHMINNIEFDNNAKDGDKTNWYKYWNDFKEKFCVEVRKSPIHKEHYYFAYADTYLFKKDNRTIMPYTGNSFEVELL